MIDRDDCSGAETLIREAIDRLREAYGEAHSSIADALYQLFQAIHAQERFDESLMIADEIIDTQRRVFGPGHARIGITHNMIARRLQTTGHYQDAARRLEDALRTFQETSGSKQVYIVATLNNLASVKVSLGLDDQAAALFHRALQSHDETEGADGRLEDIDVVRMRYGMCLQRLGRHNDAVAELEAAHRNLLAKHGPEHRHVVRSGRALARSLRETRRAPEAEVIEITLRDAPKETA